MAERPAGHRLRLAGLVAASLAALLLVGAIAFNAGSTYPRGQDAPPPGPSTAVFISPDDAALPTGPQGEAIRRGRRLFLDTRGQAGRFVGNGLSCGNCHLDGGRRADAAPMWAAWGNYPAWREKNHRINTIEDRIHDCFSYSMNAPASPSGDAPPPGSDLYRDLEAYFAWLATGAPAGKTLPGRGFPKLTSTALGHDPARGAAVFAGHCAACHGADGQGRTNADGSYTYPPLWGARSYNWGAGMATVASAAGFILANMPYGQGYTLSQQQAWDVAAFVDSHERPRDPRQTGSIADARRQFHAKGDYYGQVVVGDLLGDGIAQPGR